MFRRRKSFKFEEILGFFPCCLKQEITYHETARDTPSVHSPTHIFFHPFGVTFLQLNLTFRLT